MISEKERRFSIDKRPTLNEEENFFRLIKTEKFYIVRGFFCAYDPNYEWGTIEFVGKKWAAEDANEIMVSGFRSWREAVSALLVYKNFAEYNSNTNDYTQCPDCFENITPQEYYLLAEEGCLYHH